MTLDQFFHITRAACAIANVNVVTVFGANAILPWLNDKDIQDMRQFLNPEQGSRDLDLCIESEHSEDLNTLIDGAIGELSQFDATFGVYAHPNPIRGLFQAPSSWQQRIRIEYEPLSQVKIIVPHYLDLIVSKIIAGRPKDQEFALRASVLFEASEKQLAELIQEYSLEHHEERAKAVANWESVRHALAGATTT